MSINIKIEEATNYYAVTKGEGYLYDREMDIKNWIHPAKHINIIEGQDDSTYYIHAYTDGSKNEAGVGSQVVT